jgi:hypothetical protein
MELVRAVDEFSCLGSLMEFVRAVDDFSCLGSLMEFVRAVDDFSCLGSLMELVRAVDDFSCLGSLMEFVRAVVFCSLFSAFDSQKLLPRLAHPSVGPIPPAFLFFLLICIVELVVGLNLAEILLAGG